MKKLTATPCTITLDMKLDADVGTTAEMAQAIEMLIAGVGNLPCEGLKLTFATADEQGAEKLEAHLELLLEDRGYGVVAEITRKSKRGLLRKLPPPAPTPIEREIARAVLDEVADQVNAGALDGDGHTVRATVRRGGR